MVEGPEPDKGARVLDCRVLRHLMLKSNGRLSCDDSAGYGIDLGEVTLDRKWSAAKTFSQPIYAHVRTALRAGRAPWPGTCERCDLFSPGGVAVDTLDHSVSVQVEPTLACALRCPSCQRGSEVRRRQKSDYHLSPQIFERFLTGLARDNIAVSEIQYIGWGEPLDHPEFARLVNLAREILPQTYQIVHTNGNADASDTLLEARIDEVVISADGATEASYPIYRRGGKWPVVSKFMRDIRALRPDIRVEWKYILFDFNDSDAEILRAQEICDDLGLDGLLFIITNSLKRSERYTADNLHRFPLISPGCIVSPAAALQRVIARARVFSADMHREGLEDGRIVIDKAHWTNANMLEIEGWAIGANLKSVPDLICDLGDGRRFRPGRALVRTDVTNAFPQIKDPSCGYKFRVPAPNPDKCVELIIASAADAAQTRVRPLSATLTARDL